MRDLYKHLRIDPAASAEQIAAALSAADPQLRDAARMILLDQHRRTVYDRNRQLLLTIGQLRARLGLNHTAFWARTALKDFTFDLAESQPSGRKVNSQMIAQALRAAGRHGRRHASRWQSWIWAAIVAALIVLVIALWQQLGLGGLFGR